MRILLRRQLSEEMGDAAARVMSTELGPSTVGFPQAPDQHLHEPEYRARMVGDEVPKRVCSDDLNR
jgi:hypothetical protein